MSVVVDELLKNDGLLQHLEMTDIKEMAKNAEEIDELIPMSNRMKVLENDLKLLSENFGHTN